METRFAIADLAGEASCGARWLSAGGTAHRYPQGREGLALGDLCEGADDGNFRKSQVCERQWSQLVWLSVFGTKATCYCHRHGYRAELLWRMVKHARRGAGKLPSHQASVTGHLVPSLLQKKCICGWHKAV